MARAYLYILTNKPRGVLYLGMTNQNFCRRMQEHRTGAARGFAWKYNCRRLVWIAPCEDVTEAAAQERRMKRWRRAWKIALIEQDNPHWRDLIENICGSDFP